MKQFLSGVAATVIGGFILFWATTWYAEWENPRRYSLSYTAHPAAGFLSNDAIRAIRVALDDDTNSGKIGIIRIANEGSNSMRSARVIVRPTESEFTESNLHGFGYASPFGFGHNEPEIIPPTFQRTENGIEVTIPYLDSDQGFFMWVLHEPPQGFSLISDTENLNIEERSIFEVESDIMDTFGLIFLVAVIALFAGAGLMNAINNDMLKKAGYNPKEILASYYRRLAEDQEGNSDKVDTEGGVVK